MTTELQVETPELIEVYDTCTKCEGKGYVVDEWPKRVNRPGEEQMITCTDCNGNGEVSKEICSGCKQSESECTC